MTRTTYAEAQGKKRFDWRHALANPEQFDRNELIEKAGNWVTCACGNQCAIIPRHPEYGCPMDADLRILGSRFSFAIEMGQFEGAKAILDEIDKRAEFLIAQITGQPIV